MAAPARPAIEQTGRDPPAAVMSRQLGRQPGVARRRPPEKPSDPDRATFKVVSHRAGLVIAVGLLLVLLRHYAAPAPRHEVGAATARARLPLNRRWSHLRAWHDDAQGCVTVEGLDSAHVWALFGRLSGSSLHLLSWDWRLVGRAHVAIGCYATPRRGRCFIELLALANRSRELAHLFWERLPADVKPPTVLEQAAQLCMNDPKSWQLTQPGAEIHVRVNPRKMSAIGWWEASWNGSRPTPLQTRYQPQQCRDPGVEKTPRCQRPMSIDRFIPYQPPRGTWRWNRESADRTSAPLSRSEAAAVAKMRLCVLGASHGDALYAYT